MTSMRQQAWTATYSEQQAALAQSHAWHSLRDAPLTQHAATYQLADRPTAQPAPEWAVGPAYGTAPVPAYSTPRYSAPRYSAPTYPMLPRSTYQRWSNEPASYHASSDSARHRAEPEPWLQWLSGLKAMAQVGLAAAVTGVALIVIGVLTAVATGGTNGFLFTFFGAALVYGGFKLSFELAHPPTR